MVLGAGWPGAYVTEAVGHGLEGDFNRRGTSVFSGQDGEQVAFRALHRSGRRHNDEPSRSAAIDDLGCTPCQYNVLIENGVLKGYMQDKAERAPGAGAAPTGNGS